MELGDILKQMGGIQSVARELGVSESQAATGVAALLPAVLGGLKKQTGAQGSGIDGLMGMLNSLGGGSLLDNVIGSQPTNVSQGNDVLGQIFKSKDVSRAVAQHAAGQSGLDTTLLKKMLPMVAMLVTGYMAKQGSGVPSGSGSGALGKMLGGVLGGGGSGAAASAGPGLGSLLDQNGNGNPLDDILGMAGKMFR
ncbi:MAG: DUF937 domain-containing protein [Gammaproteobacteria bacterium]